MPIHLILLAAGEGSRMLSDRPKALHEIAGLPLFAHALASAADLGDGRRILVVGHGGTAVEAAARMFGDGIVTVRQDEQLGTAHAVRMAAEALAGAEGDALVLYADTPFIRPATLVAMREARAAGADIVVLGFEAADPGRYGRLIGTDGALERIVEWKDATAEERAVTLCNSGVVMAEAATLMRLVEAVGNDNASGEYYLTDIVGLARDEGLSARIVTCAEDETLGVNTRADLARAEAVFQSRARSRAMEDGVTLQSPETVFLSYDTVIGRDAVIEPFVVMGPGVTVESGATIRAFSHLEGCHVSAGAVAGPYSRLRLGAELAEGAKVGNFVEVKNAAIGQGAKVSHLSYVGDASVGDGANIGAGTITCNYDGVFKHRTEIGAGAFIGSNTMLVAPVRVGENAMTGSGSVITRDVPEGDLALARGQQVNKAGMGRRLMEKLRAEKARKAKG